jgi:hypothetical protein
MNRQVNRPVKNHVNSQIDKFSGKHTELIIVAGLIVLILLSYVVMVCVNPNSNTAITTGVFSILGMLINGLFKKKQ